MKISLITVCWNCAGTVADAMRSVAAQDRLGYDLEYIVVDGGSTDGTAEKVAAFAGSAAADCGACPHWLAAPKRLSRVGGCLSPAGERCGALSFRWVSERDDGLYDAMNKGVRMATGDVVGILNADDVLESPGTLSHVAAAFADGVDAVYADVRFVRDDLDTTVRRYGARHWRPWMHNWGYMPPHPGVYLRRELFGRLGPYRTGYRISADFELMVRYLCRNGVRRRYLPECVVRMRMGGKSTRNWRANVLLNVENVRANRENGYFCCLPMMLPKYLFKIWGFVFRGGACPRPVDNPPTGS